MKREIYVMLDAVSGNFGELFTMANAAELRRQFEQLSASDAVPSYAIRDTVVLHVGTFNADVDHPYVESRAVPVVVLRGENFVEKNRCEVSEVSAAASELHVCENCEDSSD